MVVVVVATVVGLRGRARQGDQPEQAKRTSTVIEVWKPMSKRWGRKTSISNNKTKTEDTEGTNKKLQNKRITNVNKMNNKTNQSSTDSTYENPNEGLNFPNNKMSREDSDMVYENSRELSEMNYEN